MSKTPTLLAARDALAKGLHDTDGSSACRTWPCDYAEGYYDQADELLASGVVRDVATLADDETLVEAVNAGQWDVDVSDVRWRGTRRTVTQHLRALAVALAKAPA